MKSLLLSLTVFSSVVWAQGTAQPDRKGCVESKIVTRMPGCYIMRCDHKDYNVADMPRAQNERNHQVEGEYESTVYHCPADKSRLSSAGTPRQR